MTADTVTLHGVEIFKAGRWKGTAYDDDAVDQIVRMFSYIRAHPGRARALGYRGPNDGRVPVLLGGHDDGSPVVGVVKALGINRDGTVTANLDVPADIAEQIKAGELVAVSASVSFSMMAYHLRHVALLPPDVPPAVTGLRALKEYVADG